MRIEVIRMTRRAIEVKVNVKGFDVFNRKMEAAIRRGLGESGKLVQRKAIINAPRRFGDLKRSIKGGDKVRKTADGYEVSISPSVKYGPILEVSGFKPRKEGRIPFMKPALTESVGQIKNLILGELRRAGK